METFLENPFQVILTFIVILSSLGVVLLRKPVHATLSFLLTLFCLALFYLHLSAEFIAVMQILVYAGAILVIFMYVIVLFQDAYLKVETFMPQSNSTFLYSVTTFFLLTFLLFANGINRAFPPQKMLPEGFGSVQLLGKVLYLDFFFPFEAVTVLFLIAAVGAVYVARRE